MKKIKLYTVLLTVALIAGVTMFYACKKEENNNSEKKLTKEASFVAKNYDETCVQVDVFRDENNNVQFVTKNVANDPKIAIGIKVSDVLNLEPLQTKDDEGLVIGIPNDAIYWLVPFDGSEPVKFEPIDNAKTDLGNSGTTKLKCDCWESSCNNFTSRDCEVKTDKDGKQYCAPKANSCCYWCVATTTAKNFSSEIETVFVGTTYLVKSEIIEINGKIYE
jgi:hypothetical protein